MAALNGEADLPLSLHPNTWLRRGLPLKGFDHVPRPRMCRLTVNPTKAAANTNLFSNVNPPQSLYPSFQLKRQAVAAHRILARTRLFVKHPAMRIASHLFMLFGENRLSLMAGSQLDFLVYHTIHPIFICHSGILLYHPCPDGVKCPCSRTKPIHWSGAPPVFLNASLQR